MSMRKATDEDVYKYLLGNVKIPELYLSPIPLEYRKKDTNESFGLYVGKDNVIRWKDWGMDDPYGNKAVNLVMYLRQLPMDKYGFAQAMTIIENEITDHMGRHAPTVLEKSRSKTWGAGSVSAYIEWNDKYKDYELEYWKRFGILESDLTPEWIYPLKSLKWAGSKSGETVSTPDRPAYVYIFRRNPLAWKLYRPTDKPEERKTKFRQMGVSEIIEGAISLPEKCDTMLIVSSTKDRVVVKKAGFTACNPTGETSYKAMIKHKDKLKQIADRIVVMFDADDAGYNASKTLAKHIGVEYTDMRSKLGKWKDFSDFVDSKKGSNSYKELKTIINNSL